MNQSANRELREGNGAFSLPSHSEGTRQNGARFGSQLTAYDTNIGFQNGWFIIGGLWGRPTKLNLSMSDLAVAFKSSPVCVAALGI